MFREKEERHTRTCRYLDRRKATQTDKQTDSINVGASRKIAAPVTTLLVSGNVVMGRVVSGIVVSGRVVSGSIVSGRVVSGSVVSGKVVSGSIFSGRVASGRVVSGKVVSGRVVSDRSALKVRVHTKFSGTTSSGFAGRAVTGTFSFAIRKDETVLDEAVDAALPEK